MEFFRQGYWSRLPFPSPGDLPNPGIELRSPSLEVDALPFEPLGKSYMQSTLCKMPGCMKYKLKSRLPGEISITSDMQISICMQGGRPGFDPWIGKIPWRRKWQPTPVFLPGESWTEEPGGLESWQATVHRIAKSWTGLNDFTFTFMQMTPPLWQKVKKN